MLRSANFHKVLSLVLMTATSIETVSSISYAQSETEPTRPPQPPAATTPAPPPVAAQAPLSPVAGPTPAEIRDRRVRVDIDSTKGLTVVERRVSTQEATGAILFFPMRNVTNTWEEVCVTPCQVHLDRYSSYRVRAANGITGTKAFTLPQTGDTLKLNVEAGNAIVNGIGKTGIAMGTVAVIVGVSLLATSTSFKHEDDARLAGFVTGGAGLLALAIGIPLAFVGRTRVVHDGTKIGSLMPTLSFGHEVALTPKGLVF